jgi:amino acid transporter
LFVFLSLLVVAELIAMTPKSGGIYAMVAHAYGPYPGFLIGWTDWVSSCATIALKTVVLLEYISLLAPSITPYQTIGAVMITSCFAYMQLGGVRLGAGIQRVASTGIGLIMIALAIALFYGFWSNGGTVAAPPDAVRVASPGIAAFGLVVAAVVFTYDGWYGRLTSEGKSKPVAEASP